MDLRKGFLVVFFICCYVPSGTPALSKAALQQTKSMMKNLCKRNSGVSQDLLNKMKEGVFTDDQKFKCYIHCCLGMMKTMRKDKITAAEATKQIEALLPDEMKDASLKQLNACKDSTGTDACDTAFNFIKCCYESNPNNLLIPT